VIASGGVASYKNKVFQRFARKNDISDAALNAAARAVLAGKADVDLGGGVYKQRVARDGAGQSGGFRTLLLYKIGGHAYFAYGFAKNSKRAILMIASWKPSGLPPRCTPA